VLNCLITGGAGFIGSHLVEALLADGARVTVADNFDPFYSAAYKRSNLLAASRYPGFRLVEADIRDLGAFREIAAPYDCIIHLAAKAGVRPSISDPFACQQVNVAGTQNMLELARQCSVPLFIFASSSSVYGINPKTPWSESDCVLLPISPYASSKVSGELLGHVYSHLYGIRFLALRLFSVYGPRQRPDLAVRKFAELILANRPIPVFGNGNTYRDYTYVDDIVSGILAATAYRASNYEVINIGNSASVRLLDMIRALEEALGRKAEVDFRPEESGDVPDTHADISKAQALLGYRPQTPLSRGIANFVSWLGPQ
jgi:UDP-glucuronate 4-epimerase